MSADARSRTFAVLSLCLALACDRSAAREQLDLQEREDPARALTTTPASERAMPQQLVLVGTLVADRQSDLAANASGRVLATKVERGQEVKAGDIVVLLDARLAKYSAKAAAANSKAAKAQLALAALECDRADKLLQSGTISKTEYDRTMSQCETTQSSLSAAQSNAALASAQAGDTVVKAPFAGIVGERFVDIGEYVQPATRVMSLYSIDPIRLSFAVPEREVGRIASGQNVVFTVSALPGQEFSGEVRYISAALREATRDLVVEAVAPNPERRLRPGMFASVRVAIGEIEQVAVPTKTLQRGPDDGDQARVWVVRSGRAVAQVVRTGAEHDGYTAIVTGVAAGESVVVDPPADLVDGTRVE